MKKLMVVLIASSLSANVALAKPMPGQEDPAAHQGHGTMTRPSAAPKPSEPSVGTSKPGPGWSRGNIPSGARGSFEPDMYFGATALKRIKESMASVFDRFSGAERAAGQKVKMAIAGVGIVVVTVAAVKASVPIAVAGGIVYFVSKLNPSAENGVSFEAIFVPGHYSGQMN